MTEGKKNSRSFARSLLMVIISVALIFGAYRLSNAGSPTPPAAPTSGTLDSLASISAALIGPFDSSGVIADPNGSALQISKCIINRLHGIPCP
ncbi:MAG TPA: hypothetical protein VMU12_01440 [Candidatus Paceibacterota bacterium]|nr:hypothetical protein [Candidatus Paceibacterota bacterium]